MLATDWYRNKTKGFADLLAYASVIDNGIIILKDGSMIAGWRFEGKDTQSTPDRDVDYAAVQINNAMRQLGSGWAIHTDAIRSECPEYIKAEENHFSSEVTEWIERERQELFNQKGRFYKTETVLILSYLPPMAAEKKVASRLVTGGDDKELADIHYEHVKYFKTKLSEFENGISTVMDVERLVIEAVLRGERETYAQQSEYLDALGGNKEDADLVDHLLSHVNRCITGRKHPIVLPKEPAYLDILLANEDFVPGMTPMLGEQHLLPIAITGYPPESYMAMFAFLDGCDCEYRWNNRYILMGQTETALVLDKYKRQWKQKIRGIRDNISRNPSGDVNNHAVRMTEQIAAAQEDIESGEIAYGYFTSVIMLYGRDLDEIEAIAERLVKLIRSIGYKANIETLNATEAYLGTLPGARYENVRRPPLNTLNMAHLLPYNRIWTGEERAPCPFYREGSPPLAQVETAGCNPFYLNLHVNDIGHMLVAGPTGAGKSTLLAFIAAQFDRYPESQVFFFDIDYSSYSLVKGAGGRYFDINNNDKNSGLSPFGFVETEKDMLWFVEWVTLVCQLNDYKPTPKELEMVRKAALEAKETGSNRLFHVVISIQSERIKEILQTYCTGGTYEFIGDAKDDSVEFGIFNGIELSALYDMDDKCVLPALDYLFYRISRTLDGNPKIIVIDEGRIFIQKKVARERLLIWLDTMRKQNVAVIFCVTSLAHLVEANVIDTMKETFASCIFLPNPMALEEGTKQNYVRMGLTGKEISAIKNGMAKRDYFYSSQQGSREFRLAIGAVTKAFVGASSRAERNRISALIEEHGEDWTHEWLKERGVSRGEIYS